MVLAQRMRRLAYKLGPGSEASTGVGCWLRHGHTERMLTVLRLPGVLPLFLASCVARLPMGALGLLLGLFLLLSNRTPGVGPPPPAL